MKAGSRSDDQEQRLSIEHDEDDTSVRGPRRHSPIRIAEFSSRLERLHVLDAHDDQLDEVCDEVCKAIFGATLSDLSEEDFLALPRIDSNDAEQCALDDGFDITNDDFLVRDWEVFCLLIIAKRQGLLPGDNETPTHRLKREAARFTEAKRKAMEQTRIVGQIRDFNEEKGFGFIHAEGIPDIFVHISEARRAGVDELYLGQILSFEVEAGNQGKTKAVRLRVSVDDIALTGSRRRALLRQYEIRESEESLESLLS